MTDPARATTDPQATDAPPPAALTGDDSLVEDVSIDGMCGVY